MKASKFLIAENPIVNDGRVFIVHLRDPVIIAEAFHFDMHQEKEWMECKSQFKIGASVDYPGELISIGAVYVANDKISESFKLYTQKESDNLAKIMSRMGDWYYNYLKWEDKQ